MESLLLRQILMRLPPQAVVTHNSTPDVIARGVFYYTSSPTHGNTIFVFNMTLYNLTYLVTLEFLHFCTIAGCCSVVLILVIRG